MGLLSTIGAASARAYGFTRSAIAAAVDAYFNLTTLLLPGNGTNGAQNNTFLDSSSNNFTITRNGNTTQGTFTPFSQTGWSNYFSSGQSNYITTPSTVPSITGDYTAEAWIYLTSLPNIGVIFSLNASEFELWVNLNNGITYYTGAGNRINTTSTVSLNTWTHIALVRSSGVAKIYINGVADVSTYSSSATIGSGTAFLYLGRDSGTSGGFNGYISNARLAIGAAVYTSNFTPPTVPLGATSGGQNPPTGTQTYLLTCQSNRFVDNSSSPKTLTITGTPSVQAFSPFAPTDAYSTTTVGGSGYLDGTGDYLSLPTGQTPLLLGNSDFTFEAWVYKQTTGAANIFFGQGDAATAAGSSYIFYATTTAATSDLYSGSTSYGITSPNPTLNEWAHVAFVRTGGTFSSYLNGVRVGTRTDLGTSSVNNGSTTYPPTIGAAGNNINRLTGYISGARLIKGSGGYNAANSTITIPTAPPTAITNTSLLCNFTNAGITDATAKNVLETVGNAQISTTQSKWGGSSMYFDGTGDYLLTQSNVVNGLGTGNWTIEYWVNPVSVSAESIHVDFRSGSGAVGPTVGNSAGGAVFFQTSGVNRITGSTLSTGTWTHIAVSKSGSSTKLFINGTQSGSTYTDANTYTTPARVCVGVDDDSSPNAYLNGYIDDLRITKGYARYTANFTAPTAAFALQ